MSSTFILVKPDGVRRGLVGAIVSRFETKGLRLTAIRMLHHVERSVVIQHYVEHCEKSFFNELVAYITSGPVVLMRWNSDFDNAVAVGRALIGATDPTAALPGSIRGDFGINTDGKNLVHASDSDQAAHRELELWFKPEEIVEL